LRYWSKNKTSQKPTGGEVFRRFFCCGFVKFNETALHGTALEWIGKRGGRGKHLTPFLLKP